MQNLLKQKGIDPAQVVGYDKEYTTHLGVASVVKAGVADCGMGVYSAAHAMGLDFLPVGDEQYDFLLPAKLLDDPRVQAFVEVLRSPAFAAKMGELGGYRLDHVGEVTIIE